jgi:uncharacterized protein
MDDATRLDRLSRAMQKPEFYLHETKDVEVRETHISKVFLTGDWVYKIKKPVELGFLDFRRLEDRKYYCQREIDLNRRLSTGLYENLTAIYQNGAGFNLTGDGQIVEYAVRIKQLPDDRSLKALVIEGRLEAGLLNELGRTLSGFHARADRDADIELFGRIDKVSENIEENFRQLAPFEGSYFDKETWTFVQRVTRDFLQDHQSIFLRRIQDGKIRDGHGDLRAEHVYFLDEVQIIDCIEFNDRFRYGDQALDLAFLYMDLDHLEAGDAARTIVKSYARESGDLDLYLLLDFYACYRSVVRQKVACFQAEGVEDPGLKTRLIGKAASHLEQAYKLAVQFARPAVWVFFGLAATGKSHLAEAVSSSLEMELLQSDRIRRQVFPQAESGPQDFGQGQYSRARRNMVYAEMLHQAQESLKKGGSVILDATFNETKMRDEVRRLAQDRSAGLVFIECDCPREIIRERLVEREHSGGVSDARLKHLEPIIKAFEPPIEIPGEFLVTLDTSVSPEISLLEAIAESWARLTKQARQRLSGSTCLPPGPAVDRTRPFLRK